jgi:hypothetical protein
MGLQSGGSSLAVAGSTCGVAVLEAPLNGRGVAVGFNTPYYGKLNQVN